MKTKTKVCLYCQKELDVTSFNKSIFGINNICKACGKLNRSFLIQEAKRKALVYKTKRENKWKSIGLDIKWKEYQNLFEAQRGKCSICDESLSDLRRTACLDHCHTTNKVRGIVCSSCNKLLGFAKDNIKILQNAIKYLENE